MDSDYSPDSKVSKLNAEHSTLLPIEHASGQRKTLIVGSGCFGLSTAWALLKRGWTDVTVIDKAATLPAPDAASNDLNRAQDAIKSWKAHGEWHNAYHECGVVVLGSPDSVVDYKHKSYLHDLEMGVRVVPLENHTALSQVFPPGARVGSFWQHTGYLNQDSGWANAGQGVSILMSKVTALHGKIITGKTAIELIQQGPDLKTTGVRCSDGTVFEADLVILATGSWTGSSFPNLPIGNIFQATEEADIYKNCPVVLDFESGFYIFPPNEQNLVKMAIHAAGYIHGVGAKNISTPRTITSDPETGLLIPKTNVKELRDGLRMVYPTLADKPFVATRMCWYNDSFDSDWFLPVIGQLVADAIEGKLSPELVAKFALDRVPNQIDESRRDTAQELDLSQLCTPEDLQ
ncbi:hypothetical protein B0H13DRAFT_1967323 [Mycena leptocephala]|nr:hypothetical protein B0H13DRAFT_1967323 [Mycena leptocephala]